MRMPLQQRGAHDALPPSDGDELCDSPLSRGHSRDWAESEKLTSCLTGNSSSLPQGGLNSALRTGPNDYGLSPSPWVSSTVRDGYCENRPK